MIKSLKRKQGGFTLIELMVVIVIIGILVAIALPNFIGAQDRAKVSSVKANMHTVQTISETYAVDWGGVYAANMAGMKAEATVVGREYWKEFTNPFTGVSGASKSYTDIAGALAVTVATGSITGYTSAQGGQVLYNPTVPAAGAVAKYYIYGVDKAGLAIRDKGQNLALTNS